MRSSGILCSVVGISLTTFRDNQSIPSSRVTLHCVMSQKSADLIYIAAEACNHAQNLHCFTLTLVFRHSYTSLKACFNFFKPLKQKLDGCSSNQVSAAAMTSASDEKWRPFNCFFQSREQVVVLRGRIRRIGWVIKKLEAQVGQFLLGCKCPASRGTFVQEQDTLGDLPAALFLQNSLQLPQQR